jgi:ribosomal protein S18 acetylase RimI-like enzyme
LTWSYGGLREVYRTLLRRARRLYHRRAGLLFEEDLTRGNEATPPPPGVEVRVLGDGDWPAVTRALTTRARRRIVSYMTPENTCFIAWREGRPVGFAWLSEPSAERHELPIPLPRDVAYGWDLWVDPRERRHGVGSALVRARLAHARERGFPLAWRVVIETNRPALRTLERSSGGAVRVVGKIRYLTFLGRTRVTYEPALRQPSPGTSIATSEGPGERGGVDLERSSRQGG